MLYLFIDSNYHNNDIFIGPFIFVACVMQKRFISCMLHLYNFNLWEAALSVLHIQIDSTNVLLYGVIRLLDIQRRSTKIIKPFCLFCQTRSNLDTSYQSMILFYIVQLTNTVMSDLFPISCVCFANCLEKESG